ncbi:MAG: bifunctional 4-hydroxy-2-oxoglutarate aldolase/2-dehydro-3-deoxy-phosphogluconate aldolase [Brevinemataceae bacterium]
MESSITRILKLKFLPIIDFETVKNWTAFIETMLAQDVSVLQVNFKTQDHISESKHIGELMNKFPEMCIGAGFVYSQHDAEILAKNGLKFIISPVLANELLTVADKYHIPAVISGLTPTELYNAQKTNSKLVQIFPAAQLNEKCIASIIEHMPNTQFMLTGGLTLSSALDFLRYGVKAVGVKGSVFQSEYLVSENYSAIANSLANFKNRVQNV